jgi:hypothetical protein
MLLGYAWCAKAEKPPLLSKASTFLLELLMAIDCSVEVPILGGFENSIGGSPKSDQLCSALFHTFAPKCTSTKDKLC